MPLRVAFVVNPIAGMGGKVGLKGTDGMVELARDRGAEPVAPDRAALCLARLAELRDAGALAEEPAWLTAAGPMGAQVLQRAELGAVDVVHTPRGVTTAEDTRATARAAVERGAQLLLFCGGDGTARDVAEAVQGRVPILGIPAGVKMHSAVFAVSPEAAAEILAEFEQGLARPVEAEILDVDEEAYRRGEWRVRLFGMAKTLEEPMLRQVGKLSFEEVDEREQQEDIAAHVAQLSKDHPRALFLLGPGSTLQAIGGKLGVDKTLLGFDAWAQGQQVGQDLDERGMLALLDRFPEAFLVLSPIGAQGFFLGRGNQQASAAVVRRVGVRNLIVVATPTKLRATPMLRVDTGDAEFDREIRARGHWPVVLGFRTSRMVPVAK